MTILRTTLLGLLGAIPLAVGLAACSPLIAINALSSGNASQVTRGLAYGPLPRQKLDVYAPRTRTGPVPVVVFFYGGNWTTGERADYAFVGHALAARGYLAVIADYRLYPDVHYPEILQDAARAVAWAAMESSRHGGDPARLFVMGHSAGAYNAAMLALDASLLARHGMRPHDLRGWIGLAGPYDFLPIENTITRPVFFYPDTPAASQPIHHVTAEAPPALLIAPAPGKDKLVDPQRNTGGLARALRALARPVTETYFDKVSHTTLVASLASPLRMLAPTLDAVSAFIDANSKTDKAADNTANNGGTPQDTRPTPPATPQQPAMAQGTATQAAAARVHDKTPAP
ncbi:alpha/beta hydrolase [Janthinobacterium sp. PLB04]|uniref:Alpha/beta hydrolase n=1 Tax=Janthinobacterium lividum TaxID=29581 RepID=A0AAJ4MWH4_9BURK|nr:MULTISPECIES: alpha/beta hydrolase [Janthinobacterium]KAB0324434.1 alpha/beta hydrolase [Janthinobacterium lividum]QSX98536.1 alpha/beta hydrolase [Janthinobacterium lividum]UGQ38499.1 alpha/beta hydrolase [Janthinobacterium sp. PLB04]